MKTSLFWGGFVPHIRVELMIFCVRGRCPGPLDECGSFLEIECKSTNFFETGKIFFKNNYISLFLSKIFLCKCCKQGRILMEMTLKNNNFRGA